MGTGLDFSKRLPSRLPEHVVPDALYARLTSLLRAGLERAQQGIGLNALEEAARNWTLGQAIQHVPFQLVANRLLADLTPGFMQAYLDAIRASAKLVPESRIAKADDSLLARLGFRMDGFNPFATRWAESHVAQLIFGITEANKAAIRALVVRMFEEGIPPRQAARLIRGTIGLTERDANAVLNFYRHVVRENGLRELARLNTGTMSPAMRARYLRRTVLTEARVMGLVERYQQRMLKARAEMIARTESTTAAIQGQLALWEKMVQDGILDGPNVRMKWILTPDERLCPVCASIPSLPNNLPPIGGKFRDDTGVTYAWPPAHPNCRCALRLVFRDKDGNFPPPDPVTPAGKRKYRSRKPTIPKR